MSLYESLKDFQISLILYSHPHLNLLPFAPRIVSIIASMPTTTIHCVRHAQGWHNVDHDSSIPDPDLTPLGINQCKELRTKFPYHSQVTHLVASPLRRTLLTCLIAFSANPGEKVHKVKALPELQETANVPSDVGSNPSILHKEFDHGEWAGKVDLSLVKDGWCDKSPGTRWEAQAKAIEARAKDARRWLRNLGKESGKDADIVVVTHGGFLHYFTEDWSGHNAFVGTGWTNTEFRSYRFVSEDDDNAGLVETPESQSKRDEKPLTQTEKDELRMVSEPSWTADGIPTPNPKATKPETSS